MVVSRGAEPAPPTWRVRRATEVPGLSTTHDIELIELVRSFVNTLDIEEGADAFASPDRLAAWLRERDLLAEGARADVADVAMACELREALRSELATHQGALADAESRRRLDALAAALPLRLAFAAPGGPVLAATGGGVRAGLSSLLAAVADLAATGAWPRLKICPAGDCQWAFYDESRNRSRRWCSMESCGNRHKIRAFRQRHGV